MTPGGYAVAPIAAVIADTWDWPALDLVEQALPNGLRIILAENRAVPFVFLGWTSHAGFECDPPGLAGLASLTPALLREGTARRSGTRITRELDDLGADLAAGSDWDGAFLNLGVLSPDLAAGAALLIDMATTPEFPRPAVARLRQRRLDELARRQRDQAALASDGLARALFGDGLYGRPPLGTPSSVRRIDAAEVASFHEVHYQPGRSSVVVAGSFEREAAIDLFAAFDAPLKVRAAAWPALDALPVEPRGGVRLVDVPHATRSEIRLGQASVARDDEALPALEVLNAVLGGGPTSRLTTSLRQRMGLTYHVRSRFAARRLGGVFVVETAVANAAAATAVRAIRREITSLQDELVPEADVEQAKRRLFGAELRRFQDLIGTGATLGPMALHDDPVRRLERRRQAIAAVDPEALRDLARRHLHPERLTAVVVGPADALRPQFSSDGVQCEPLSLDAKS